MTITKAPQQDNSTFPAKIELRRLALQQVTNPVVMETHGGYGELYDACYYGVVETGVVFEREFARAAFLARQRPAWAVYEGECQLALAAGVGSHLTVNLLDVDPYGSAWDAIPAFFNSPRPFADRMALVVNDGLRYGVKLGKSWQVKTLQPLVERFGNDLWDKYLDVCGIMLQEAIQPAGYSVRFFDGYYAGIGKKMTHFLAILEK